MRKRLPNATWFNLLHGDVMMRLTRDPAAFREQVRTLTQRQRLLLAPEERRALMETLMYHELRAHLEYRRLGGKLSRWRRPSKVSVDFVYQHGDLLVPIECKASERFRPEDLRGLAAFTEAFSCPGYGVYWGANIRRVSERIELLPLEILLARRPEILAANTS